MGVIETIINPHPVDRGGCAVYFLHWFTFCTKVKLNSKSKNGIAKIVSLRDLWVIKLFGRCRNGTAPRCARHPY